MSACTRIGISFICLALIAGCGSDEYRTDVPEEALDAQAGRSIKEALVDLRETINTGEEEDAIPAVMEFQENISGVEASELGEAHAATFETIKAGVDELQKMAEDDPTKGKLVTKINELIEKAESLPGKGPSSAP